MGDAAGSGTGGSGRWPLYTVAVIASVGAAVTGVSIAASHPSGHAHRHGSVFVVVFAGAFALAVGAMVTWSLRRRLNHPAMQRLRGVSFSDRRAVIRAVNSGRGLTDEQQTIARAQLELLESLSTRTRWVLPAAVLGFVALAMANTGGGRWLWAALAALELLSVTSATLLYRRQRHRITMALIRSTG